MLIKRAADIRWSDVTDKRLYLNRREFLGATAFGLAAAAAGTTVSAAAVVPAPHGRKLTGIVKSPLSVTDKNDKVNSWKELTTFNNYYEFGIDKGNPAQYAGALKTEPWKIVVDGECAKKGTYAIEDILKGLTLEERIYRHRCVEAWSMVIPWVGVPLASVIKRLEPTSKAQFVRFTTLADARQMPGIRSDVLSWPYVEGLRMDEAMHPLTILAVGLYDEVMPKQNGAPIRLVVPWKYGFKGAKSIVKISFVEKQFVTSWQLANPSWYGFYSNVNPRVSPVRWDQATEQRIGEGFLRRRTQMFNGYADQVQNMYAG
ncbi:MAG TPA: protein-methionine-sulfoxide reductase catalytic subunit MsrP, partial [Vicinamibacterales bacterium]|nr:protein-methionine-sulfoxide reductase catalytic subunit MsrP [Vicinamibacterales bacterium]